MKSQDKSVSETAIQASPLELIIEGSRFTTTDQYKTGAQLKQMAKIPLDTELYLSISKPYKDELIENEKVVNLARPDTEYFFVKKKLFFTINNAPFTWYKQFIRGLQIRQLGNISPEDELYLDIKEGWQDDIILDDEIVDLARPGREHFLSKEEEKEITIIINSRDKPWNKKTISFDEVIMLKDGTGGNGNKAYTITYSDGPRTNPSGEMAKGDVVDVKKKMKFYATATDKS